MPRGAAITFDTDRLLAPRTVSRGTVTLLSGNVSALATVRYDPARRRVTFLPHEGETRAGLEYFFVVQPGLTAWDGARHGATFYRRVVVTDDPLVPDPGPRATLSGDVAPVFARRCAVAGCHDGPRGVMGMDLSSPEGVARSTIAVLARERPAAREGSPEIVDPRWGALHRVDPGAGPGRGEPAYSYLLYKLLGDGPIAGDRMPPPPAAPLAPDEVIAVADWIARGAPRD